MRLLLVLSLATVAPLVAGETAPFNYDRTLAVELSVSYVRSYFRQWAKAALPGVDYQHPQVTAVQDADHRELVFVSFVSTRVASSAGGWHWGVTVSFQLCKEPPLLRLAEISTTDSIEAERADHASIDKHIWVTLQNVCPALP